MISSATKPASIAFEQFTVKIQEPIYATFKGKPVVVPAGYMVRVVAPSTDGWYKVKFFSTSHNKFITFLSSEKELGIKKCNCWKDVSCSCNTPTCDITRYGVCKCASDCQCKSDAGNTSVIVDDVTPVMPAVGSSDGLIPRIYQEYGIAFLLHKQAGMLADAPGVGKTLQALEAAYRACIAHENGIDPLNLCYTHQFAEDEKNTHPTERPEWAKPIEPWTVYPPNQWGITVSKQNTYYHDKTRNPVVVIVAPGHLCNMWYDNIRRQYPNEHVAVATNDTKNNRMAVLEPGCRFYIVNYEMMRRAKQPKDSDYEYIERVFQGITIKEKVLKQSYKKPVTYLDKLTELSPLVVIFDESHRLKSRKSKQAQVCAEFAYTIPYRFLLTATPIKREADDLHWQLHIVDPQQFDAEEFSQFIYRYCTYRQTPYGKTSIGLRDWAKRELWFNRIESLEHADYDSGLFTTAKSNKKYNTSFTNPNLKGYILGRSYHDVGLYLPPIITASIPVQMDPQIRELYENTKKSYRATFEELDESIDINSMIAMMHSLRILTACPAKFHAVQELVEDNEGPFVIFCEYKPSGACLAKILDTTFISGEIPEPEREPLIRDLLAQGRPIVGMGRVIGTGLNALSACNVGINFEADYTPGERTQRIGRFQRWNPNRPEGQSVLLFDVFCTDSIDQKVFEVQKNRSKLVRDIIKTELGI